MELPKYHGGASPEAPLDRWAYLFREAKDLDVIPPPLDSWPFRSLCEVLAIDLDGRRSAALDAMSLPELEGLHEPLRRERTWS